MKTFKANLVLNKDNPEDSGENFFGFRVFGRIELGFAVVLSVVLAFLHYNFLISAGPLWRDEISSLGLACQPTWGKFWEMFVFDPFPILFFSVLRGWHALVGGSDFSLRVLGFIMGLAGIASFWITARMTGRRPPTLILAVFGFSPNLLVWGDSLRPYGLGVIWIVLTFGCFWKLIENPRPFSIAAAFLSALLSVQSLFTNSLLIFALATSATIVCLLRGRWKIALFPLGIGGAVALSILPYSKILQASQEWVNTRKASGSFGFFLNKFYESALCSGKVAWWLWITVILAALATAILLNTPSTKRAFQPVISDFALYALLASVIGLFGTICFLHFLSWPTNTWYYLPCLAVIGISGDRILQVDSLRVSSSVFRTAAGLMCVCASFPLLWKSAQMRMSNVDLIAAYIGEKADARDLVIVHFFAEGITFSRYFNRQSDFVTVPMVQDLTLHNWGQVLERMDNPEAMNPVLEKIESRLKNGKTVWLVASAFTWFNGRAPRAIPRAAIKKPKMGYFLTVWTWQTFSELQIHAVTIRNIRIPIDVPINAHENLQVWKFSGWKEK